MKTKPKTRKASAAKDSVPKAASAAPIIAATQAEADAVLELVREQGGDKLEEARHEMWDGLNFLKLIELADNAEDYAHAIGTAVLAAVEKFNCAYGEFETQMTQRVMREMDLAPGGL